MSEQQLTMGLGEALSRMMRVEMNRRARLSQPEESLKEFQMIVEALNVHQLTFTLQCDSDPGASGIDVFQKSAKTSCCRIGSRSPRGGSRS